MKVYVVCSHINIQGVYTSKSRAVTKRKELKNVKCYAWIREHELDLSKYFKTNKERE